MSDTLVQEVAISTVIPVDLNGSSREEFEALGFKFGGLSPDPLFQHVTLPDGWTREGDPDDMWSYLIDEDGMHRCLIFYKAPFYARSAHIDLLQT